MPASSDDQILAWASRAIRSITALTSRYWLVVDTAVAAAVLAAGLIGLSAQGRLGPLSAGFGVALAAPMVLHRREPLLALALISLIALLQWLLDVPQFADASVLFGLYWVARDSRPVAVLAAAAVVETGAIMAAFRWSTDDAVKVWVGLTGLAVAAAVLGITVRQRRALLASLEERAARLELERDREGQLGAAAERARIAREMHDIVAHNLTVMVALADAAAYAMDDSPEEARSTVQRVSGTGRHALGEMRRLLGVLRQDTEAGPLEPQPTFDQLAALIARVEAVGLAVTLEVDGDPRALDEGLQVTIYRVVQEALTNTLKHAEEATGATVRLRCRPGGSVVLEISDDGRAPVPVSASAASRSASGRGLTGMRERATAYGGTVTAGPLADSGWGVRLVLDGDMQETAT